MEQVFFEAMQQHGFVGNSGPYQVTAAEIMEFGRRFDPRPFHTDPVAAKQSVFGSLVAPASLTFAIRSALMNRMNPPVAYLAGLGVEKMVLPTPVRAGDELFLQVRYLEGRSSQSRPEAGIVQLENTLTNQKGETVLTMVGQVLVAKRSTG